jgi:hypothetical protein
VKLALFLGLAALYGQTPPDPSEVLDGARQKIRETMKRLPKYACLETIDRTFYAAPSAQPGGGVSCDQISAQRKHRNKGLSEYATDRLRIEVAEGMDKEIHSWPGASRFDLTEIDQIVDSGPFGTGAFGAYLVGIFENENARFDYRGETARDGKRLMVFGYSIAQEVSRYEVRAGDSWVTTAYRGTFEVDPESLEIQRVTLQTTELPAETGICEAISTLDYQRVKIGDGTLVLPRQSQLRLIHRNGEETNNAAVFSGCREFQAKSALRFDTPLGTLDVPAVPGKPRPPLPVRLPVDLRLTTPIDTDIAAAGDEIAATVVRDIHAYQSNEVLIPAGAVAHGRISRVERHFSPAEYILIGFAFESLEFDGQWSPFAVRTELPDHYYGSVPVDALRTLLRRIPPPPPDSLMFANEKRHVMPAGTVTHWITK